MTAHILEKFSFETNMKLHTIFPQPFPLTPPLPILYLMQYLK